MGIDLSAKAVEALNVKITKEGLGLKAKAHTIDLLELNADIKYDLIFAHGVLHHFENPTPLFVKISELLKNDGVLILTEPSTINPLFKFIRSIFRPFQSDAKWEWPFTKKTVYIMETFLKPVDGFGWGKRSLWFSILTAIPLLEKLAKPIYKYLLNKEIKEGWNRKIWLNSSVTAVYNKK